MPKQHPNHPQQTKPTPKNWPPTLTYLSSPHHDRHLTPQQALTLRSKTTTTTTTTSIPAPATTTPSPKVKIQQISTTTHPAHGQRGLFAARDLQPGEFILPYLGRVHGSATTDPHSDYDIWMDRHADLAVDAARGGNEARFVNDYRGVRQRPNAVFGTAWCERWRELCVGVWVVGCAGGKGGGIRRGDEIVVSYGKGFWHQREGEDVAAGDAS